MSALYSKPSERIAEVPPSPNCIPAFCQWLLRQNLLCDLQASHEPRFGTLKLSGERAGLCEIFGGERGQRGLHRRRHAGRGRGL